MSGAKKFIGATKKMMEALKNEGLNITWPKAIGNEGDLALEGTFTTGHNWEKLVLIDLREEGEFEFKTKADVDRAVARQLEKAYTNFDVDDELTLYLQGAKEMRDAMAIPNATRLLEDILEQESRLKRFAEVARAVSRGEDIPPKEQKAEKGETIHITPKMADDICFYLGIAVSFINHLGRMGNTHYVETLVDTLMKKMGKPTVNRGKSVK